MTPERWQKVQELFAEALEREPAERATYLTGACKDGSLRQEVELMIAAHEEGDPRFLQTPTAGNNETLKSGAVIGPYTILALIGAGGMGEVYRARDTRLGREVVRQEPGGQFRRVGKRPPHPFRRMGEQDLVLDHAIPDHGAPSPAAIP